jgi:hypothetical protein
VTNEDLQERIQNSPALTAVQNQLQAEISFRAPKGAAFDPFLVISVISIIVQVVIHCRENQDEQSVRAAMRDLRALPRRQQFRLRRALRQLWRENCPAGAETDEDPLLEAVYQLSDSADDAAIDELLWLAEKHNQ